MLYVPVCLLPILFSFLPQGSSVLKYRLSPLPTQGKKGISQFISLYLQHKELMALQTPQGQGTVELFCHLATNHHQDMLVQRSLRSPHPTTWQGAFARNTKRCCQKQFRVCRLKWRYGTHTRQRRIRSTCSAGVTGILSFSFVLSTFAHLRFWSFSEQFN